MSSQISKPRSETERANTSSRQKVLWRSLEEKADPSLYQDQAGGSDIVKQEIGFVELGKLKRRKFVTLSGAIAFCDIVGFKGDLTWDETKPDGTPRKLLDVSKIHALGWRHQIGLREGITRTYEWFLENET